jgi:hypothetical protein
MDFGGMDVWRPSARLACAEADALAPGASEAPTFEATAQNVLVISAAEWARFEARVNGATGRSPSS